MPVALKQARENLFLLLLFQCIMYAYECTGISLKSRITPEQTQAILLQAILLQLNF